MTEHVNIPDGERHEPKGISTTTAGQIYRSNGSASGVWKDDVLILSGVIPDVSTASSILIPVLVSGTILSIKAVLGGPITVADSNITITRSSDSSEITSFNISYSGSAEGSSFDSVPSGVSTISSSDDYIKVETDGASTDTANLYISIKMKVTE